MEGWKRSRQGRGDGGALFYNPQCIPIQPSTIQCNKVQPSATKYISVQYRMINELQHNEFFTLITGLGRKKVRQDQHQHQYADDQCNPVECLTTICNTTECTAVQECNFN